MFSASARWKVQLELAPAEIALVYRQGLARGAEVRRDGAQEWRPLVTTPELRAALSNNALAGTVKPTANPAVSLAAPPAAIQDRALAALLLRDRPLSPAGTSQPPPPPPPVVLGKSVSERLPSLASERGPEPIWDSVLTEPLPRWPLSNYEPELPVVSFATTTALHARPVELSFAVAAAVAVTMVVMLLVQRASHWGEVRAQIAIPSSAARTPSTADSEPRSAVSTAEPASTLIPVVTVRDLPIERGVLNATPGRALGAVTESVDRAAFARAMAHAAAAAQGCGPGPVQTRVVATFAPSGVPSAVHFGGPAPDHALRGCILNAVARSHVAPFNGEPVTVAKNISW